MEKLKQTTELIRMTKEKLHKKIDNITGEVLVNFVNDYNKIWEEKNETN